jgi:hypothetical protein
MNINLTNNHETFETRFRKACSNFDIEKLAHELGLYQRAFRKVSPMVFVFGLCRGTFNSFPSANIIAGTIAAITGICVSKQALLKRFPHAPAFLHQLLKIVIAYPLKLDPDHLDHLFSMFANVRLLDSSAIKLHPSFVNFFPGARNQTGQQSATMKIQLCYNLTSGILDAIYLSPYTRNDQKASVDIFTIAKPNDLVIRDLGYFSLDVLGKMVLDGIYFITRLRPGVLIFNPDFSPVDLLKMLKKHDGIFDQNLILGAKQKLLLRLIAIPLPPEEARKRRAKAKKDRNAKANHSEDYYELLRWTILVTNVPSSTLSSEMIHTIYLIRWKIEIIFKIWKSFLLVAELPNKSNISYLKCVIYAKLILLVLFNHTHIIYNNSVYQKTGKRLSPMKLAQFLALPILQFFAPINPRKWTFTIIEFISYYCAYEKRKRQNMAEWIAHLIPVEEWVKK